MIYFNKPIHPNFFDANFSRLSGDGDYTYKVNERFRGLLNGSDFLLTTSCTSALEMAALLLDVDDSDEIIAPSFTFVSTVNAFVLRGAKIVFVDIDPLTMNIDVDLVEGAISPKTKAIVVVHYAGVSCEMDRIMDIAAKNNLFVIEDAAQGVMAKYNGKFLGSIGHLGTYSFHESKNYSMGEGGAIIINDKKFLSRAEIIREKGTDRSKFFRGQVDKYTWIDLGSSYLPSDILAYYLLNQLEIADEILLNRLRIWNLYYNELRLLKSYIDLPYIPGYAEHNAHMFYIKVKNLDERSELMNVFKNNDVQVLAHYVPLHSSPAGQKHGRFFGEDKYTTTESERLLRLPIYYNMKESDVLKVCRIIKMFYMKKK